MVTALAVAGCREGSPGRRLTPERERSVAVLMQLYEDSDFFDLRTVLDTLTALQGPRVTLLRAAVANAFNDPARSNRELAKLTDDLRALPDSLRIEAYRLRFRNHLRLYEYAAAAETARRLLTLPAVDSAMRADVTNDARVAAALAGSPPQRVLRRAASEIHPGPDGRIPVRIGDSSRSYGLDTGANLSVMMRSEAEALRLPMRRTGVWVGTSTGSRVTADVAIAPRVRLGRVELANVVFLVLPDEALTFGSFRIPGLIGFPVVDALGEVEFRRDGVLRIPASARRYDLRNLAMKFFTPLVQVEVLGEDAVCVLDTGASHSALLLPFYARYRDRIEAAGRPDTIHTAGAGGERRIPAYVLSDARIMVGDTAVTLPRLPAYTESVEVTPDRASDCRLGRDVLDEFGGYVLNLRSMTLLPS